MIERIGNGRSQNLYDNHASVDDVIAEVQHGDDAREESKPQEMTSNSGGRGGGQAAAAAVIAAAVALSPSANDADDKASQKSESNGGEVSPRSATKCAISDEKSTISSNNPCNVSRDSMAVKKHLNKNMYK